MTTREEVLKYCLSFSNTYQEAPFYDENWQLVRCKIRKHLLGLIIGIISCVLM